MTRSAQARPAGPRSAAPRPAGRRAPLDPRLWRYSEATRGYLAWTVATSVLDVVMVVVTAIAIGRILAGAITTDARSIPDWGAELIVLLAAIAVRVAASWLHSRYAHRTASRVVADLEQEVLDAATGLPPRQLYPRRTEVVVVVTRGLDGLRDYLTGYVPAVLSAAVLTPVVIVVIALYDLPSALIVVVTLPLIPLFMILIGFLTKGKAERTLAATTTLSSQLLDLLAGLPTLRALGREKGPEGRIRDLGDRHRRTTMSALRVAFLSGTVLEFLATLSVALVAVGIGMRLVYGLMPLEAGVIALILAPEAYRPLREVGTKFHAAEDGLAAARRAFAVLDAVPDGAAGEPASPSQPYRSRETGPEVVIAGLGVAGRDGWAPYRLDARCRPGEITALTGENGAGKTTTTLALLGLAEPDQGTITVDGSPVAAEESWWRQVAWLPQRPVLLPGTLAENLEMMGVSPRQQGLGEVCVSTGFDEVLAGCPDGWGTVVGAEGTGLSLGQRQRLALTRTLASDRPVLLLDEPTAHLDPESEARVLDTLLGLARAGRTVIVVAHRPSILAIADTIVPVRASTTAEGAVEAGGARHG
ncbi:thiol reductant ABC exporter subunit CydD [Dietzia aerolata]|uniref:Thiol reductant ABC exporter subunit CydD n=1 Tax=Dietzia aerolata TaxID=595984 RepID=A0ABV5JPH8_9ACTN|nr:thiol reductant ABC exporter subunit CydD [Dietzia aerolata]MBB0968809.1 thiol reductant ABC exporter subunit CydD [Dietzia aerolata]HIW68633.1 thiol reductant ABC exporter subunit CydD [Candidatus Dietzia merdigallinarum]